MSSKPGTARYRRILVKLSGEALLGNEDYGIDPLILKRFPQLNGNPEIVRIDLPPIA